MQHKNYNQNNDKVVEPFDKSKGKGKKIIMKEKPPPLPLAPIGKCQCVNPPTPFSVNNSTALFWQRVVEIRVVFLFTGNSC